MSSKNDLLDPAEPTQQFDTACLHAGQVPDPTTGSRAVPIYATSSFVFADAQHAADLFALKKFGNIYSRLTNPTNDVLEKRLAALDGGVGAVALSSGSQAVLYSVLNIAGAGQNLIASTSLYGGTWTLFAETLRRFGIEVRFFDPAHPEQIAELADPRTRAVYTETIGNPRNDLADLPALSAAAHAIGVPLIADNTALTPALLRPFEHGVDIAVYSLTKFLGGHGNHIGGALVDSGSFDWSAEPGRWPEFNAADPSYNGVKLREALEPFGNIAYITRARTHLLRDLGGTLSPFAAFLFLQGIETLHLRMPRHAENAQAVAEYLARHPDVAWVNYPGLDGHPSHELATELLEGGFGALVGFGLRGGAEAGRRFVESVRVFSHLANIGDAKSLAIHPASTTHSQLDEAAQQRTGVTPDYVRLSVGLESIGDLIADLDLALGRAVAGLGVTV